MVTCDECGKEFDSERGLHVHQAQAHEASDDSTVQEQGDGMVTLNFKATHALLLAFIIGVFAGGFLMSTVQTMTGSTAAVVRTTGNAPSGTDNAPSGNNPSPSDPSKQPTGSPTQGEIDPSKISLKGEPTRGQSDAPITIVMYEDLQCPFCKQFETNALPKIVENYVNTGKAKLVWKDFPLPQLHPWAEQGAAAMECVYRQDAQAFWPVKNKVFQNQNTITTSNVVSKIKTWAADEGVSKSAVQSCLDNGNPMQEVNEDKQEGSSIGVSGTPTVFINGKKLVGAQPYSRFRSVIESELSG